MKMTYVQECKKSVLFYNEKKGNLRDCSNSIAISEKK